MHIINRYRGALMGLAVGDALGTTLEFKSPGSFEAIKDMVGGGPFGLAPGEWTDDTSMALCLTESLLEKGDFDPIDQMQRYVRWWQDGYLSSTGECFDIGNTVAAALANFNWQGDPFAGETHPRYGGNGSLMRLAPIPLAYSQMPEMALINAAAMSRTTHGSPEPVDACRVYTALMLGALSGVDKSDLFKSGFCNEQYGLKLTDLTPKIAAVIAGTYKMKHPPEIRGTGYVVNALEAALWAFWNNDSFEEGALAAVNLGDDADTTGAIYGQLAGSYYGQEGIPKMWHEKVTMAFQILKMVDDLHDLSLVIGSGLSGPQVIGEDRILGE